MDWMKRNYKGILFALMIALVSSILGFYIPIIGGPVFGIVLGIVISNIFGKPKGTETGLKFTSKNILQYAIIALGGGLSFTQVYKTGLSSLYVMLFTIATAFLSAYILGRLMKIPHKLTSLIGMGTAICGGSAIAAISPIIDAEDQDIAYSISTIFLFNVIAVLIFPPIGHLLGLSDNAFGLWAGTAINDTSSVVAAGYSYANAAGAYATIVKLTRTTMIIPISLIFAFAEFIKRRKINDGTQVTYSFKKIFPWFIIWFLVASLLNTTGLITGGSAKICTEAGKFMIVLALSAIGLNSDFKKMMKTGFKPILMGMITWFAVAGVSLIVQFITGQI